MVPWSIAYCTNVHPGADWPAARANLQRWATAVRRLVGGDRPLGVGLWLSARAAVKLEGDAKELDRAARWLDEAGLAAVTMNGFPYGDFHQKRVKHAVYEPAWWTAERLEHTLRLARILARLAPPGATATISTLPLGWRDPPPSGGQWERAAEHVRRAAGELARLERRSGRRIILCLEPEPGCLLERSGDVVRFLEQGAASGGDQALLRRHVGVCHDICHAAVMFEDQREALARYAHAGWTAGKIQVSNALEVGLSENGAERRAVLARLEAFAEDRYLHQTVVRDAATGGTTLYEDLPGALQAARRRPPRAERWRIHFHTPIFLARHGPLGSTQADIRTCLAAAARLPEPPACLEVETYAWSVLPAELRPADLAVGVARELTWLGELLDSLPPAAPSAPA